MAAPSSAALSGLNLRILPLGDSITFGIGSSDGNSYRGDLQKELAGNNVTFIGTQKSGKMANNAHEGHSGWLISMIAGAAKNALPMRPNVVLLDAGGNDMLWGPDPADAPTRLGSLIDQIVVACPDAALLVANLLPTWVADAEKRMQVFNAAVPGVIAQRAQAGKHVLEVDMAAPLTTKDLSDGVHPNDVGYQKMADAWYAGIVKANANGWIKDPVAV